MKKVVSVTLACVIMLCAVYVPVYAEDDGVSTSARACVLYCVNSGGFLLEHNADERLPMASTTKIMTALLTLEDASCDNRVITFSEEMTAEGSSMYLNIGERLTLYDLAVGMLMQSGNDAANAAAISVAGSVDKFADMMNARARKLGMNDTHFVTPSGLDDDEHYSTAHDMALLMDAAMRNSDFADITRRTSMTVSFTEPADKTGTYPNHNKLLAMYDGCIGGKTGYTDSAGRCLVTCAERDGLRLIAVTLDDGDDWDDHTALYDWGFENYAVYTPDKTEYTADVVGGTKDTVRVCAQDTGGFVIQRSDIDKVKSTVYLPAFLYAPLSPDTAVGEIVYILDDRRIGRMLLYPTDTVEYNND